jgi:outer membrane protein OmpA-like peptidoglycan-associated protein
LGYRLGNKKKDNRIQELEDKFDRRITEVESKTDSLKLEMDARKKESEDLKAELKRLKESTEQNEEKIEELEKRIEILENAPEEEEKAVDPLSKLVYFDENKSTINSNSQETLNEIVTYLNENPDLKIRVVGNTCDVGSTKANKDFSATRAKVVVNYLVGQGISADRITAEGRGEDDPLFPNNSEVNRSLNRRVSFERR